MRRGRHKRARRLGRRTQGRVGICSLEGGRGLRGAGGRWTRSHMFDCFCFFVLYAQVAVALKFSCGRWCWHILLWLAASVCRLEVVYCSGGPS